MITSLAITTAHAVITKIQLVINDQIKLMIKNIIISMIVLKTQ